MRKKSTWHRGGWFKVIIHHSSFIVGCALAASVASAQSYPERPVRLVVPAAPGGAIDIVGRIVGQKLSEVLGQNVVIDNRAGANNIIGTELAARAAPNGYTLLITAGAHTINPAVYRKLPYDALRDFTPVTLVCKSSGLVIVVHPSFPAKTLNLDPIGSSPAAFGKFLKEDLEKYARIAKAAKIEPQ